MDATRITTGLSQIFDPALAKELVAHFIKIRQDFATKTLERASSGKFVETFVQCLQHIASGTYEQKPNVDDYLNKRAELELKLPDGLRICAARIARAIYTLRNKRNIAHKGQIDPNTADLAFTYYASAWIMAELLRNATGVKMEEAGALIALIQAPVGALVEDIGGVRIVLRRGPVRSELLLLLHSHYPDPVSAEQAIESMSRRRAGTVKKQLGELHKEKLAQLTKEGYRLTQIGFEAAVAETRKATE